MKPTTNRKVENLINDKFNRFDTKANNILENILEIEYKEKLESLKYSNEIAEERIFNGIKEHRHISNMYWHPITRIHASTTTKDKLPQCHVLYGKIQTRHESQKPKDIEELISEGFSKIPKKNEFITKSQIIDCIFPLNHISKENFDKLPKNIINIIHNHINYFGNNTLNYELLNVKYLYYKIIKTNKFSEQFKSILLKWLDKAVIPCIIKTIKNEMTMQSTQLSEFKPIDFTIDKDSSLYIRIDKIVRDFYDSFYDNSSLCLYYTYYLLKLKGNHDFDFDFIELENKLYNNFYNYGIFAILGELSHFLDEFNLIEDSENSSIQLDDYIIYSKDISKITFKKEFKESIIKISECTGLSKEDIYKIIKISHVKRYLFDYKFKFQEDNKEKFIVNNIKFLYLIEKYFGYLTRPDLILNIAIKAFNEIENKCFWSSEFGGNSWATIAKTMLNRNNMISKTIFVDTCWSLQHNTELFINKVYNSDKNIRLLENYLTDIKNGLFRNVYKCAVKHNKKLDRFIYKNIILDNDNYRQ